MAARFRAAALRDPLSATPVKVLDGHGYTDWDLGGEAVLVLFSRQEMAKAIGTDVLPASTPTQDASMLVLRVDDVEDAARNLSAHGATVMSEPQHRPEWGERLRTSGGYGRVRRSV